MMTLNHVNKVIRRVRVMNINYEINCCNHVPLQLPPPMTRFAPRWGCAGVHCSAAHGYVCRFHPFIKCPVHSGHVQRCALGLFSSVGGLGNVLRDSINLSLMLRETLALRARRARATKIMFGLKFLLAVFNCFFLLINVVSKLSSW